MGEEKPNRKGEDESALIQAFEKRLQGRVCKTIMIIGDLRLVNTRSISTNFAQRILALGVLGYPRSVLGA